MYIFLLSLAIVSIISLCFFKKRFWENRYLILLISALVALVATLTTNYATRGNLGTRVETIWQKPIQMFAVNDSFIINTIPISNDEELDFIDHRTSLKDTCVSKTWTTILIHGDESESLRRIGYYSNDDAKYKYLENVYIAPSESDTVAYYVKKRLYYDNKPSKWLADFSLPYIKTIKCFYIPPTQYAALPDSIIRELPF